MHVSARLVWNFMETLTLIYLRYWFSTSVASMTKWSFHWAVTLHFRIASWSTVLWSSRSLWLIQIYFISPLLTWNSYFFNTLMWIFASASILTITLVPVWSCILLKSFHLTLALCGIWNRLCSTWLIFWWNHLLLKRLWSPIFLRYLETINRIVSKSSHFYTVVLS